MTHILLEFFPEFERGHLFVLRILIVVIREAPPLFHHSHGSGDSKLRSLLHSLYSGVCTLKGFLRYVLSITFFILFSKIFSSLCSLTSFYHSVLSNIFFTLLSRICSSLCTLKSLSLSPPLTYAVQSRNKSLVKTPRITSFPALGRFSYSIYTPPSEGALSDEGWLAAAPNTTGRRKFPKFLNQQKAARRPMHNAFRGNAHNNISGTRRQDISCVALTGLDCPVSGE